MFDTNGGVLQEFIDELEEKNAKYTALNESKKTGFALQIDDGLIANPDIKKCDKGLCIENNSLYLIELKGVDFNILI